MYYSLFIHSPPEGHLGCFPVLAIMDKAAIINGRPGTLLQRGETEDGLEGSRTQDRAEGLSPRERNR